MRFPHSNCYPAVGDSVDASAAPARARDVLRRHVLWVGPAADGLRADVWRANGFDVEQVANARGALLAAIAPLLVVHAALPDGDGLELAAELLRRRPDAHLVVVASQADFATCRRALLLGALDVLPLPVQAPELLRMLQRACDSNSARRTTLGGAARIVLESGREEHSLRHLVAALVIEGFGPFIRARVASAVAQVLGAPNIAADAMHIERVGERLEVTITGRGADLVAAQLRAALGHDPRTSALNRAVRLAENIQCGRSADGWNLVLTFHAPAAAETRGWDEREWIDTTGAQAVLSALDKGAPALALNPALGVVVGCWVGRHGERIVERRAQRALWS